MRTVKAFLTFKFHFLFGAIYVFRWYFYVDWGLLG